METILSAAGKPGLYKLVSQGKGTLIVESLDDDHRRLPLFMSNQVTSLSDIAMFTDAEDVPLWQVLENVGKKEQSKECSLNYKKSMGSELRSYFEEVLPNFDKDRVHDSDIRKLIQWYNILVKSGRTDFKALLAPEEPENDEEKDDKE